MANLSNDIKKNANGMALDLANKVHDSKNQVSNFVYDSGEKIGSVASDIADSALDSFRSSRDYVKQNPYSGFAIAGVTGLLAGALLSTMMRRK